MDLDQRLQHTDDLEGRQVPRAFDPQPATGVLVNHGEEAKRLPVRRLARDGVVAPHMVGIQRLLWLLRARPVPTPSPLQLGLLPLELFQLARLGEQI